MIVLPILIWIPLLWKCYICQTLSFKSLNESLWTAWIWWVLWSFKWFVIIIPSFKLFEIIIPCSLFYGFHMRIISPFFLAERLFVRISSFIVDHSWERKVTGRAEWPYYWNGGISVLYLDAHSVTLLAVSAVEKTKKARTILVILNPSNHQRRKAYNP